MKVSLSLLFIFLFCSFMKGQNINEEWYKVNENNGIIIQNSFPKGGPYTGPVTEYFNYSYLVFFYRVMNETGNPFELNINFSGESFAIPNSPDTFVKLFLPPDTMTLEKRPLFSYGFTELESLCHSTSFQCKINPNEDCLFYVVAVFYQTNQDAWNQERGGNRAEFIIRGQELFYEMSPQVNSLPCGQINMDK